MTLMELIDAYAGARSVWGNGSEPADEARAAVVEAVEKLERDAARLDWLNATGKDKVLSLCDNWYTRADYGSPYRKYKNLREAIDAAMKEATNGQDH